MSDRRTFLRGLAALPLIGGGVTLIGNPTAAAVPVTPELMHGYKAWLCFEHKMLCHELAGYDVQAAKDLHRQFYSDHPAWNYHFNWPNPEHRLAGWEKAPQPSTRAAVVLSAVGCPLSDPTPPGPYYR